MKIEFYPLWMKANPELFKTSKERFLSEAKSAGLNTIKDYWQHGLYYMEARQ